MLFNIFIGLSIPAPTSMTPPLPPEAVVCISIQLEEWDEAFKRLISNLLSCGGCGCCCGGFVVEKGRNKF
jgi:hypothetical protein